MNIKVGDFLYHILDANEGVYYEVIDKSIFGNLKNELFDENVVLLKKCSKEQNRYYLESNKYTSNDLIELYNANTLSNKYFIKIHKNEINKVYFKNIKDISMIESVIFQNKRLLVIPKEFQEKPFYGKIRKPLSNGYPVQYLFLDVPQEKVNSKLTEVTLYEISLFGLKNGLRYDKRIEDKKTGIILHDVLTENEPWIIEHKEKIYFNGDSTNFEVVEKWHLNYIKDDIEKYRKEAIERTIQGISEYEKRDIESKFKKSLRTWVTEEIDDRLEGCLKICNF